MTKRKLSVTEMVLQGIAVLLFFLPGMYNRQIWYSDTEYSALGIPIDVMKLSSEESTSFTYVAGSINLTFQIFGWAIIALISINILILLISFFKQIKIGNIVTAILPVLSLLGLVAFSAIAGPRDEYGYAFPTGWMFYLELFLLIATIAIAVMKFSKKIPEESPYVKVNANTSISNADELKKYKELLDNGVITQDEFASKKEELLHL